MKSALKGHVQRAQRAPIERNSFRENRGMNLFDTAGLNGEVDQR